MRKDPGTEARNSEHGEITIGLDLIDGLKSACWITMARSSMKGALNLPAKRLRRGSMACNVRVSHSKPVRILFG